MAPPWLRSGQQLVLRRPVVKKDANVRRVLWPNSVQSSGLVSILRLAGALDIMVWWWWLMCWRAHFACNTSRGIREELRGEILAEEARQ